MFLGIVLELHVHPLCFMPALTGMEYPPIVGMLPEGTAPPQPSYSAAGVRGRGPTLGNGSRGVSSSGTPAIQVLPFLFNADNDLFTYLDHHLKVNKVGDAACCLCSLVCLFR